MALEKFKFWKHKEPELPPEMPADTPGTPLPTGLEPTPTPNIPPPGPEPAFQQMEQMSGSAQDKDMQLIGAKLDVLKAQLDNITQRLEHLERLVQESGKVKW